ncbi:MAG: hypothetical protein U0R50_15920 [Gaiellales bacterium]
MTLRHALRLALPLAAVAAALAGAAGGAKATTSACVTRVSGSPLWVEYGDGSVPPEVRAVFSRPGVVVAATGTGLPGQYRERGAKTVFFSLKLPSLVGEPGKPADPATIEAIADRTYERAVASTACETPWIGLNELAGPANPVPWTDSVRAYRQNILDLMQRLHDRGATPVLLVHGSPVYTGEARDWWRAIGEVGHVVYESYYRAPGIVQRGRIVGPRRLRLGMRSVMTSFANTGIPRDHLGLVLGFQVAPGKMGREGLQPSQEWYRYVKWNALAARQVASDMGLGSIWSWGWGNLSAAAKDPDKPAAACVYLWARDQSLCDGRTAAGDGFKWSLVEGPIVMGELSQCISIAGKLPRAAVAETNAVTQSLDFAVSAAFVRQVLRRKLPISTAELDGAENAVIARVFGGSRDAYLAALAERRATPGVARGIIEDELRRAKLNDQLGTTALIWIADQVTAAIDTATCRGDRLPGIGNFPVSDRRESAGIPLALWLPFLTENTDLPLTPTGPTLTTTGSGATVDWDDNSDLDLLGYYVYRRAGESAPWTLLTKQPWPRSAWNDPRPVTGGMYAVRAVDIAGNVSSLAIALPATPLPPHPS